MNTVPSELVRQIAGTYIEDDPTPKPPTLAWLQQEARQGTLAPVVEKFVREQQEDMNPKLVLVERVEDQALTCRIPCRVADKESPSTFAMDVRFELNPLTQETKRLL